MNKTGVSGWIGFVSRVSGWTGFVSRVRVKDDGPCQCCIHFKVLNKEPNTMSSVTPRSNHRRSGAGGSQCTSFLLLSLFWGSKYMRIKLVLSAKHSSFFTVISYNGK